jgi:tetratricopeptide (TPR) repeat protein
VAGALWGEYVIMDGAGVAEAISIDEQLALAAADVANGQPIRAVERLQILIEAPIYDPRLHYALASALGACGERDAQRAALQDACTFHSLEIIRDSGGELDKFVTDADYAARIGTTCYGKGLMGPASAAFAQAALQPGASLPTLLSWGLSLQHQGRIDEAMTAFTHAVEKHPGAMAHSYLLYATFFCDDGVKRHAEEVRKWAKLYAPPYVPGAHPFADTRAPGRKLRIGYVAPSFTGNQLRQFILPVLENHDPERVEVYLYAESAAKEAAAPAAAMRSIGHLSDATAANIIRQDGIDVLVDLWGHTSGGRLQVFALKPAPVQVAWINYVQSTGLKAMDYVIHSDGVKAPGDAAYFTEEIWSVGPVTTPFRPHERLALTPTPALAKGHVTFGSFNHPARLNDQTVAAWARILLGRPGSRLFLKYRFFVDPVLQATTRSRFAAHGVDPDRIDFAGHTSGDDYLKSFRDIDLALDPSPCPGGTTSSDAVSNGVPLITLRGPNFYSRIGVLRLEPLGLSHLIAEDWDDYVAKALAVTADLAALNDLRASMRERFDASPMRDEVGFTRRLEDAFAQMYARRFDKPAKAAKGPARRKGKRR